MATDSPARTDLVARAEAFRPLLLAEQAATEERGYYSEETHEAFRDAGFYRLFVPRRYGGLEVDLTTFLRVVMEIADGPRSLTPDQESDRTKRWPGLW